MICSLHLQVNFEAVHNIDEWGSDFVPSMREALRCWNMTVRISLPIPLLDFHRLYNLSQVQHWLVFVVYKRFPVKSMRTTMVKELKNIKKHHNTTKLEKKASAFVEHQVMVVSSVWHGVHPGYYLGLGSVCMIVSVFPNSVFIQ